MNQPTYVSKVTCSFKLDLLEKVIKWIKLNHDKRITVDDIAKQLGYGKPVTTQLFRDHTGKTPGMWLRDYRINKAREHIKQGVKPAQAGIKVSYSNHKSFQLAYAVVTGTTPEEDYRLLFGEVSEEAMMKAMMDKEYPLELRQRIEQYIMDNIKRNIPVNQIEEHFKQAPRTLHTMFSYFHGVSMIEWRQRQRMLRLKQLIEANPNLDLNKVHLEIGVCSRDYMEKLYYKYFKTHPFAYARQLRK